MKKDMHILAEIIEKYFAQTYIANSLTTFMKQHINTQLKVSSCDWQA